MELPYSTPVGFRTSVADHICDRRTFHHYVGFEDATRPRTRAQKDAGVVHIGDEISLSRPLISLTGLTLCRHYHRFKEVDEEISNIDCQISLLKYNGVVKPAITSKLEMDRLALRQKLFEISQ